MVIGKANRSLSMLQYSNIVIKKLNGNVCSASGFGSITYFQTYSDMCSKFSLIINMGTVIGARLCF